MTQEELRIKVINAEGTYAKRKATLEKHCKQLDKLIAKGADEWDIRWKKDDIKYATRKLEDARQVLANWKDKLDQRISADAYIEANTPAIIRDFLETWKQESIAYYRAARIRALEYGAKLRQEELDARREALATLPELERTRKLYEGREIGSYELHNLFPSRPVDAYLKERGLDYYSVQEKLRTHIDAFTARLCEFRNEAEREAWLEKEMEAEKKAKMLDLVSRIQKVVGTITDAAHLCIGDNGEINGYIEGTEGRATVTTIGAGGYNIQRFHFRTLVHELKAK